MRPQPKTGRDWHSACRHNAETITGLLKVRMRPGKPCLISRRSTLSSVLQLQIPASFCSARRYSTARLIADVSLPPRLNKSAAVLSASAVLVGSELPSPHPPSRRCELQIYRAALPKEWFCGSSEKRALAVTNVP